MIFIVVYGNMIMRSVIEEKVNRIVEVIISSVPARTLLLGKIIGTSLVGITQFAIWLLLGGALLSFLPSLQDSVPAAADSHMLSDFITEVNTLPLGKLSVCFLLYFIGGYLVYSAFYAMIGAAVDNETDTQQFLLPVLTPLILAIYVGIFTVIEAPHGTVSVIFLLYSLDLLGSDAHAYSLWSLLGGVAALLGIALCFFLPKYLGSSTYLPCGDSLLWKKTFV